MKAGVRAHWSRTLLVCRKCSRRLGGGFGERGEERLAKLLRKRFGGGKGRKADIGIVEVDCLKVCPKGAALVIDAASPGEWLLIEAGTPLDEVAARLELTSFP